ncbi:MAG: helix-turn-helix domain-containing protein [Proteiniphilum sp.]|nr:helix-turn-helix domain-containing protein [Proteiniphilum sp.]
MATGKRTEQQDNVREYMLTDVASCTFTFTDGLKSRVIASPDKEIVLVKLIPRSSKSKTFEDSVLMHYSSARTINDLANLCHYDCLRTFTRHFKKCFNQTPYQWLLDRKMEEIHSLVLSSDMSITDIAKMYEFKSVSHLVNAFSKRFGIPPHKRRLSNAI